ncbi:MAG: GNAT family N-acetyltransferase [Alphaproteobacteria bacterium]|nr:GNAT family N-acetyltransferase [Alphaproteobacteria bacterium]
MLQLQFHAVDQGRWPDFEALFESRGAPHFCYCMVWRAVGGERALKGEARKACMKARIDAGTPVGLLGYAGGEAVAWVSIAPRETYRRLGGLEQEGEIEGDVWSLACFFVKRPFRGQGLTRQLITAAIAQARARGAKVLEAYPVPPDAPSYRFMGYVPTFESLGFSEVGLAGHRRHVMRLALA